MAKIVRNVPIYLATLEGSREAVDRAFWYVELVPIGIIGLSQACGPRCLSQFGGQSGCGLEYRGGRDAASISFRSA
jgi:hypothetical protein